MWWNAGCGAQTPQTFQGQQRTRLGWLSATCGVKRQPEFHGVTQAFPPAPVISGPAPSQQLQAAHPNSAVRRTWGQDKQNLPRRESWGASEKALPTSTEALWKQTPQDNLFSQANLPHCLLVSAAVTGAHLCVRDTLPRCLPSSHTVNVVFLPLPAPVSYWCLPYWLFDIHSSTQKGKFPPESKTQGQHMAESCLCVHVFSSVQATMHTPFPKACHAGRLLWAVQHVLAQSPATSPSPKHPTTLPSTPASSPLAHRLGTQSIPLWPTWLLFAAQKRLLWNMAILQIALHKSKSDINHSNIFKIKTTKKWSWEERSGTIKQWEIRLWKAPPARW